MAMREANHGSHSVLCSNNFQPHQQYAGKTLQCVGLLPMMIFSFFSPVNDDLGVWPGLHCKDWNFIEMRIEEHQQYSHLRHTSQQWQSMVSIGIICNYPVFTACLCLCKSWCCLFPLSDRIGIFCACMMSLMCNCQLFALWFLWALDFVEHCSVHIQYMVKWSKPVHSVWIV
jgi:hypothetical protein